MPTPPAASRAAGRASGPGPSRPVSIGIVGAGFIGQVAHLRNYTTIPNCRVVAIAELRPGLRRRVAEWYQVPRAYETHHELLKDPDVEAVVVVTARQTTGPVALDCLTAGKHVLTEKPMAGTADQAEVLVQAARRHGVRYAVGYMKRYDEGVERAKGILDKAVASRELGPITFVRVHCFQGNSNCNIDGQIRTDEVVPDSAPAWPTAPDWVPEGRRDDYHRFLNVFCHDVNLLRYLLGGRPGVDFVRFDPPGGRVAVLDGGGYSAILEAGALSSSSWEECVEVYFAHGRLRIETPPPLLRNVPARVELYRAGEVQHVEIPRLGWTWAFRRQAEAFVTAIREGHEPLASGSDALEDMRLIEEMWRMELRRSRPATPVR